VKVIFYKAWVAGNIQDKFVSIWTLGPYSHCELLFSDGTAFSSSWRDGGTRFKKINIIPERWDMVDIETDKEEEIKTWCETQLGKEYDWRGVFSIVIPFILQDGNKWYCSEICIHALRRSGIVNYLNYNSPNSFYRLLVKDF